MADAVQQSVVAVVVVSEVFIDVCRLTDIYRRLEVDRNMEKVGSLEFKQVLLLC
jgi:hypothetical protein